MIYFWPFLFENMKIGRTLVYWPKGYFFKIKLAHRSNFREDHWSSTDILHIEKKGTCNLKICKNIRWNFWTKFSRFGNRRIQPAGLLTGDLREGSKRGVWQQVTMAGSDSWEHILNTYCVHLRITQRSRDLFEKYVF